MKINVTKLACSKGVRDSAFAIDKYGRLYDHSTGVWTRYRTFCTRYENREYFETYSKYRNVLSGQISIEVPEL